MKNEIEKLIKSIKKEKQWQPGIDWVQYSGPYFSDDEYIAATTTIPIP